MVGRDQDRACVVVSVRVQPRPKMLVFVYIGYQSRHMAIWKSGGISLPIVIRLDYRLPS
jgi:hypothetical protein